MNKHLNLTVTTSGETAQYQLNHHKLSLLFFSPVDDAFVQSIKDMFGGEGSKKNLVDPFLEARFAGRKVPKQKRLHSSSYVTRKQPLTVPEKRRWHVVFMCLQLRTQIIEKNANPEWNQLLNLQVKVRWTENCFRLRVK